MVWKVYKNGKSIKTYPTKLQCCIWAFLNRYVYTSRRNTWLDPDIKITKES